MLTSDRDKKRKSLSIDRTMKADAVPLPLEAARLIIRLVLDTDGEKFPLEPSTKRLLCEFARIRAVHIEKHFSLWIHRTYQFGLCHRQRAYIAPDIADMRRTDVRNHSVPRLNDSAMAGEIAFVQQPVFENCDLMPGPICWA